jgi:hypothetical protein
MKQATQWFGVDKLELWEENPNEGDVGAIMMSIKEFGYNDTGAYWNGIVKGGNHSIVALRQLLRTKWSPDDCEVESKCLREYSDENGKSWQVAMIDISHMDEITSNAFGVALNRTQRIGYDDPAKMAEILQRINNDRGSLEGTGYDEGDVNNLLTQIKYNQMKYDDEFDNKEMEGQINNSPSPSAFIVYVSFENEKEFFQALNMLSLGQRNENREGIHYATIDGSALLPEWEEIFESEE